MSIALNMHSLIRHFEERLRQIDRQNLGDVTGKEPHFPQLVVYLGKDASNAHTAVSTNLLQIWPQYQDELKFLCIQKTDGITYFEMPVGNEQGVALSENDVREMASALFGTRMHFADRSKLLVYFILDTTSMQSLDEFLSWLPVIHTVKALLCPDSTDLLNMLCLLLNENLTRQKTAAKIRNYLSCFYTNEELRKTVNNVLLLSNRRNDNAILEDWEMGYKIISATIALSNNEETRITTNIFCNSVLTASYAREEKPISQIGQVVVGNLLLSLAENTPHTDPKLMDDPKLAEKLGLTKNGTFTILDQYAQANLYALLPSEEQLELFPRRDATAQVQMSMLSANAFNEFTMGAWNQYLEEMIRTAKEKLEMNSALRQKWGDAYRKFLADTFKKEEILYLADHIDDVVEIQVDISIDSEMYRYYRGLGRYYGADEYQNYVNDANNKKIAAELVSAIRSASNSGAQSDAAVVREIAKFVQDTITYQYDLDTTGEDEYPRYPIETLYERQGDCEDTSILMAALLKESGYEVGFLHLPGHLAVVLRTADDYTGGAYYEIDGHRYLYIESTASGWNIGDIPEDVMNQPATFYAIP